MRTRLIYSLYRLLQALALPLLLLYFLSRCLRDRRYWGSLAERFGFLPHSCNQTGAGSIWLHAVSVGEVLACVQLLRQLKKRLPGVPLLVSTSTLAGRAMARERLDGLADGVFFAPVDYVFAVRRVLRRLKPHLVIVAETEIWPNLFRESRRSGCRLLVVNGRISDRAQPNYTKLKFFFRHVLRWPDRILVQSESIRQRYFDAGAPAAKLAVAGNLKYDFDPGEAQCPDLLASFLERLRPGQVWMAASTMPPLLPQDRDEDDIVIETFRDLCRRFPKLLLVLVPRRPERFEGAAQKLNDSGVRFLRRSTLQGSATLELPGVLLLDSIGELTGLFARADAVFMGGTLASRGGHNVLEPAFYSKPIVAGPHMENFRDIAEDFRQAGAYVEISEASGLGGAVAALLEDPVRSAELGSRAFACARARRGVTARITEEAVSLYRQALPRFRPSLARLLLLWPFSLLWRWGGQLKRSLTTTVQLPAKVISVGNLTMGGTGKTPFVLMLAKRFDAGILTRGYRRQSSVELILDPGAAAPVGWTGDEPQILLREGVAPVGVGANRVGVGRRLIERFGSKRIILDDGFQHARLARQVDLVLVDALDPFSNGHVFPLGRLREPLAALRRATLIVITRSEGPQPGLEAVLRNHSPSAPIFSSRVVPLHWVRAATGERVELTAIPATPTAAFCGLGNPASFWRTLAQLGIKPALSREFPDHHRYTARDMQPFAGYGQVFTTEKDAVNLPAPPANVYWLKIAVQIDRESEFWEEIERQLTR